MSKCARCGKTVYFGERQQYEGKDFHGLCLQQVKKEQKPTFVGYYPGNEDRLTGQIKAKGSSSAGASSSGSKFCSQCGNKGRFDPLLPCSLVTAMKTAVALSTSAAFEYENVAAVDKDLLCPSCSLPLCSPVMHLCGALLCFECAICKSSCPSCFQPVSHSTDFSSSSSLPASSLSSEFLVTVPLFIRNRLNDLRVKCNLCLSYVARGDYIIHKQRCPQPCPLLCGDMISASSLSLHLSEVCLRYTVKCKAKNALCEWEGPRSQLKNHLELCKYYPLTKVVEAVKDMNDRVNSMLIEASNLLHQCNTLKKKHGEALSPISSHQSLPFLASEKSASLLSLTTSSSSCSPISVLVCGGYDGCVKATAFKLCCNDSTWSVLTPLPDGGRDSHACVQTSKGVVVAGGSNAPWHWESENTMNTVYMYDTVLDSWIDLQPLTRARKGLCGVCVNDCVYVLGGQSGTSLHASVERYDMEQNRWLPSLSLPSSVCDFACVSFNSCIYSFGGYRYSTANDILRYDTRSNRWDTLSNLPLSRTDLTAILNNNSIFLFGGSCGLSSLSRIDRYDVRMNRIEEMSLMLTARSCHTSVSISDNHVLILGGYNEGDNTLNSIEMYTVDTNKCVNHSVMLSRNMRFNACVLN